MKATDLTKTNTDILSILTDAGYDNEEPNPDFVIHKDGSVTMNKDIYITSQSTNLIKDNKLAIKFRSVKKDMVVKFTNITSLENFPQKVLEDFVISSNLDLISLKGGPTFVDGHYNISFNKNLKSLEGIAKTIKGDLKVIDIFGKGKLKYFDFRWALFSEIDGNVVFDSGTPKDQAFVDEINEYFNLSTAEKEDQITNIMELLMKKDQ